MAVKTSTARVHLPQAISTPKPVEVEQGRRVFQYTYSENGGEQLFGAGGSLESIARFAAEQDVLRKHAAAKLKWAAAGVADLLDAWTFAADEHSSVVPQTDGVSDSSMRSRTRRISPYRRGKR